MGGRRSGLDHGRGPAPFGSTPHLGSTPPYGSTSHLGSTPPYGSTPAWRAATTASPRVWAPSFRMADRR